MRVRVANEYVAEAERAAEEVADDSTMWIKCVFRAERCIYCNANFYDIREQPDALGRYDCAAVDRVPVAYTTETPGSAA